MLHRLMAKPVPRLANGRIPINEIIAVLDELEAAEATA